MTSNRDELGMEEGWGDGGGGGGVREEGAREGVSIDLKRDGRNRGLCGRLEGASRSMMDETFDYIGNMREP